MIVLNQTEKRGSKNKLALFYRWHLILRVSLFLRAERENEQKRRFS